MNGKRTHTSVFNTSIYPRTTYISGETFEIYREPQGIHELGGYSFTSRPADNMRRVVTLTR